MTIISRRWVVPLLALGLVATTATAWGLEPEKDGWYFTGSAIRTKTIFNVKVFSIRHDIKVLPKEKSRPAVIDADVDKKLTWQMLRDVDPAKVRASLDGSFAMNGYGDRAKIGAFLGAFSTELKNGSTVVISYDATSKTTTVTTAVGSATVEGVDFMKAVWSIWFGKVDPPSFGDELLSRWN